MQLPEAMISIRAWRGYLRHGKFIYFVMIVYTVRYQQLAGCIIGITLQSAMTRIIMISSAVAVGT